MTVEQLNQKIAIPDQVKIIEGKGGFPVVEVSNEKATAKISVYSGHVISFKPAGEAEDLLFLSDKAYYKEGKAMKGGIPICWPWFGPDPEGKGRASHGFVRNRMWELLGVEAIASGETKVRLGISSSEETLEIWPNQFELVIEILVGTTLTVTLITRNTGDNPFSITQALHTYFATGDISKVRVLGFENARFVDKADGGAQKTQTGDITITEETDRIYTDVKPEVVIDDGAMSRKIRMTSTGSSTAIVWNPWKEISVKMADLEDNAYQQFICVETANAEDEVIEVAAGADYKMQAVYAIERS